MKPPAKTADEDDWVNKVRRRMLSMFGKRSGHGKAAKRSMNKRARKEVRPDLIDRVLEAKNEVVATTETVEELMEALDLETDLSDPFYIPPHLGRTK